jgi:CO/xanthine dehydrogenase FAD-binding subunit
VKLPPLRYIKPATIAAALDAWADHGGMFLAGGQGLLSDMGQGLRRPGTVIDVSAISELTAIKAPTDTPVVRIGAATPLSVVTSHPALAGSLLAAAAGHIGAAPIRALATVGGNFCHGNPTAELPLAALVAGATLVGLRPDGSEIRLTGPELSALRPEADRSALLLTALEWPVHGNGHAAGFAEFGEQRSWSPAVAIGWLTNQAPNPARPAPHARIGVALRDGGRFVLDRPDGQAGCTAESVERAVAAASVRLTLPVSWLAGLIGHLLGAGNEERM